ncbi:MAG: hypothetical protein Tsb0034_25940 [Ekhidna sp.]
MDLETHEVERLPVEAEVDVKAWHPEHRLRAEIIQGNSVTILTGQEVRGIPGRIALLQARLEPIPDPGIMHP